MTNFNRPQPYNVPLSGVHEIADETAWWVGDAAGVQHLVPYDIPPPAEIEADPDFYPIRNGVVATGKIG